MYGGIFFRLYATGTTSLSAATAHKLLGNYNGLSALNNADTIHLQLLASANNVLLYQNAAASTQTGLRIVSGNDYYVDLPAMRVDDIENLHLVNETGASNAVVKWAAWNRPY